MTDQELIDLAISMQQYSYIPYSHFPVGAALLCSDGTVYTGCNIECASYGAAICAERTALVKAVSEGHRDDLVKLAVACDTEDYGMPCGICRQLLYEFAPNLTILVGNKKHEFIRTTLSELLPHGFGPDQLEN